MGGDEQDPPDDDRDAHELREVVDVSNLAEEGETHAAHGCCDRDGAEDGEVRGDRRHRWGATAQA